MIKIAHIAIWTGRLEELKNFYETYFDGKSSEKYTNPSKGFESYFLRFGGETTLELMRRADILTDPEGNDRRERPGYAHLAFSVGDEKEVCRLTEELRNKGFRIAGEPRYTGDGYFESVVLDSDGNRVEIMTDRKAAPGSSGID